MNKINIPPQTFDLLNRCKDLINNDRSINLRCVDIRIRLHDDGVVVVEVFLKNPNYNHISEYIRKQIEYLVEQNLGGHYVEFTSIKGS